MIKKLNFTCSRCGNDKLEEVMGSVTTSSILGSIEIETEDEDQYPIIEYGGSSSDGGEIDRYQCSECGLIVARSQDVLVEYLKNQDINKECTV